MNPMPFIHEIRSMFDGLILLSGAMSTGQDIAAAMQMGADLAYMGTRFINTTESSAPDEYRNMIMEAGIKDIVYTAAISGVNANFLRPSLEAAGITKDMWEQKAKIDFGKELDTEAKAWKTIWSAGQGVTSISDVLPVGQLIDNLKEEFNVAIEKQSKWLLAK
jgi:nitronate monooxygenase